VTAGANGVERPIRVMLAVDDPGVLAALTDLIDGEPGMTVVGAARDANEAVLVAEQATPDVALVDVQMPGGGGARATRELILRSPRTGVVAVSAHGARSVVAEMLRAGAMGFVVKGAPIAEIVDAVRRTARGQGSLSGELTATLGLELDEHLGRRDRANAARREQIARVRRALEPGAIRPIFQPIVELGDGSVVGYEALARFHLDPVEPPDRWFNAARDVGLTEDLEFAAIRAALERFDDIGRRAYLSLNLSPASVLSGRLTETFLTYPQERLVIEITEQTPVTDYDALAGSLQPFIAHGGRLAVDDAGAGFASLRHIVRLAPQLIKLDISITRGIDTDHASRAMAAALASFGREMGISLVAEGIETLAERDAVRALGVQFGQGYLFGRPRDLPMLGTLQPNGADARRPPLPGQEQSGLLDRPAEAETRRAAVTGAPGRPL